MLYLLLLGVVGGAALVLRGWRGYRVGQEPFCAKCGYNLTGAGSSRCPECGGSISARTTLRGRKRLSFRSLIPGSVLVVICGGLAVVLRLPMFRNYDWYQLLPTSLVLREARMPALATAAGGNTATRQSRAFRELRRRCGAGTLPMADLFDAYMVHMRRTVFDPPDLLEVEASGLIITSLFNGDLTPAQERDAIDGLVLLEWRTRPRSSLRAGIPLEFDFVRRKQSIHLEVELKRVRVLHEDRVISDAVVDQKFNGYIQPKNIDQVSLGAAFSPPVDLLERRVVQHGAVLERVCRWRTIMNVSEAGRYTFEADVEITAWDSAGRTVTGRNRPFYREQRTLRTTSRAADLAPEALIRLRSSPAPMVRLKDFRSTTRTSWLVADPRLSVPVVGEAYAHGESAHLIGPVEMRPGVSWRLFYDQFIDEAAYLSGDGSRVWLDLTRIDQPCSKFTVEPSAVRAAQTVDVEEIYRDTVTFPLEN